MTQKPKQDADAARHTEISKFLSYVLRHAPQLIGIQLDENGWTDIGELLDRAAKSGTVFTLETLRHVVETNDKKRFAFSADGLRIRASQGHSVEVELGLASIAPPVWLYHGTATRFLESILVEGLKPGSRQKVHLTNDLETATAVGRRHGKPVVLRVACREMHEQGLMFWRAENGAWLTDAVPPRYLAVISE